MKLDPEQVRDTVRYQVERSWVFSTRLFAA